MRNTKQREEILSFLRSNRGHFTATQVYEKVRVNHPDISLGTVYRNLGNLCESGEIFMIETASKIAYYDGTPIPHMHFVCKKCGEIYDFPIDKNLPEAIKSEGFLIEPTQTVYHGTCKNCLKNLIK